MNILFTPGPITTSPAVKAALQVDLGTRDPDFTKMVANIKETILKIGKADQSYVCIPIQGAASYGIEGILQSTIGPNDKILVVNNGFYGRLQLEICRAAQKNHVELTYQEDEKASVQDIINLFNNDPTITHIGIVHNESTSGILNDIDFIDKLNRKPIFIVDAVASFGLYDIDLVKLGIDFMIASSNKGLGGVPGVCFVIAKRDYLMQKCAGNAKTLTLDLFHLQEVYEKYGTFRYTPPTQIFNALNVALQEHQKEGQENRLKKCQHHQKLLYEGFTKLGFKGFVDPSIQGCVVTTFYLPVDCPQFVQNELYEYLKKHYIFVFPGKVTQKFTFRIGSIGELTEEHINHLLQRVAEYLQHKECCKSFLLTQEDLDERDERIANDVGNHLRGLKQAQEELNQLRQGNKRKHPSIEQRSKLKKMNNQIPNQRKNNQKVNNILIVDNNLEKMEQKEQFEKEKMKQQEKKEEKDKSDEKQKKKKEQEKQENQEEQEKIEKIEMIEKTEKTEKIEKIENIEKQDKLDKQEDREKQEEEAQEQHEKNDQKVIQSFYKSN